MAGHPLEHRKPGFKGHQDGQEEAGPEELSGVDHTFAPQCHMGGHPDGGDSVQASCSLRTRAGLALCSCRTEGGSRCPLPCGPDAPQQLLSSGCNFIKRVTSKKPALRACSVLGECSCTLFFCLIFKSHLAFDYRNNRLVPAECSALSLGAGAPGLSRVRSLLTRFPVWGGDCRAYRQFRQDGRRCGPGVRPALVSKHLASPWSSLPPLCQIAPKSKLTHLVSAGTVTACAPGKAVSENLLVAP